MFFWTSTGVDPLLCPLTAHALSSLIVYNILKASSSSLHPSSPLAFLYTCIIYEITLSLAHWKTSKEAVRRHNQLPSALKVFFFKTCISNGHVAIPLRHGANDLTVACCCKLLCLWGAIQCEIISLKQWQQEAAASEARVEFLEVHNWYCQRHK